MPLNVYTLLCKRDIEMAKITLPKIVQFLAKDQKFVVVDDGTFTTDTIEEIQKISPSIQVVVREEREAFVLEALKEYPNCLKYRNEFPLAFKLLDIPLMAKKESPRFIFTDSDILYLKNCFAYFQRTEDTYLITDGIKLSFQLKDGLFKYKWRIPDQFNSGYFSFHTDNFNLDFIEYYLGLPDIRKIPWLSEQSCWALLFGQLKTPVYCPDVEQFICRNPYKGPDETTLAVHLIGLKEKVADWQNPVTKADYIEKDPAFQHAKNVTISDWLIKSLRRYIFHS